ncbi:hypothetical protein EKH55_1558 [Sinorhizobium alkalisoli]|nr:hypothetical protein EKH55_1558 [Sinorhizobium alkalisoli]
MDHEKPPLFCAAIAFHGGANNMGRRSPAMRTPATRRA